MARTYDFTDTARGAEAFLAGIPATSVYAMLEGFREAGVGPGYMGISEEFDDARTLLLTANSTTVYAKIELDLKNDRMFSQEWPRLP